MIVEFDEQTGQVSVQFPDVWLGIYPKGHKIVDGKDSFYNGAFLIRRGNEHVHLNAFDVGDLRRFLADPRVSDVLNRLTDEHVQTNFLRSLILLRGDDD